MFAVYLAGNCDWFRADRERILREKVRLHAEHMRERRSRASDNPVDDMRSAQRELEIVSSVCHYFLRPGRFLAFTLLLLMLLLLLVHGFALCRCNWCLTLLCCGQSARHLCVIVLVEFHYRTVRLYCFQLCLFVCLSVCQHDNC